MNNQEFNNPRDMENFLLEKYDAEVINTVPKTENELLQAYQMYTDVLYQYLRLTVNCFIYTVSNEIRALLGHISEYRVSETSPGKRDLDKAYGHFRRMNLDALKILCDEFDKTLSKILKKQCKYDYRAFSTDYLKDFGQKYIDAKNAYIVAQQKECVGSNSHTHNIIALYCDAARKYIILNQFYDDNKKEVLKIQRKAKAKVILYSAMTVFGLTVSVINFILDKINPK